MAVDLPALQQRDAVKEISPPWLCTGTNEKYMYNMNLANDALLEKMNQASKAHMPGLGTPTALPYIGLDRVMPQGSAETDDNYAKRLQKAFDTWQLAGSRQAVMSQSLLYMAKYHYSNPVTVPRAVIVNMATDGVNTYTNWDTYFNTNDLNLPPSHVRLDVDNWAWDGETFWWRCFLVLFFESGSTIGPGPVWGNPGTVWGDSTISWGFNVPPAVFVGLRSLIRTWKSGNTWYPWIIISFNPGIGDVGDQFSVNSSIGNGNPEDTWGSWGTTINGVYQASRPDDCRFVDGTPVYYPDCTTPSGM